MSSFSLVTKQYHSIPRGRHEKGQFKDSSDFTNKHYHAISSNIVSKNPVFNKGSVSVDRTMYDNLADCYPLL